VNPGIRNLIALQDFELKVTSLKKQISDNPGKILAVRNELDRLRKDHQDRAQRVQELGKTRRAKEGEVDLMRAKLSRLRDQLMAVKTNKEYTAMLHEIQMAEDQIRGEEDKILEIMEEVEQQESGLKTAEKDFKAKTAELENRIRQLESAGPGMEAEVTALSEMKKAAEAAVDSELLGRYRRIADARKGIALAEANGELCSVCHVRIRPQVYADLLQTENIHTCDSCSRILFMRETTAN
jgi:predicted  nucleic acid-binding Zn-ribbon protein